MLQLKIPSAANNKPNKQKELHDPDNHDGVITHLEPDILECKLKWALGSITMNKASGGDGIPVELFQILKDDAVKPLNSIASKFGKLSSGHRTGKGQFSFQSQRKAMPKNAQTTTQLHSSHTLEKEMATHSSILAWRIPWTEELGGLQSVGHKELDTTEQLHFHTLVK